MKNNGRKLFKSNFFCIFVVAFTSLTHQVVSLKSDKIVIADLYGPFVYRLGREVFILERGVRFPQGLLSGKEIFSLTYKGAGAK